MQMNSFSSSYGQQTFHVCWKVKCCHKIFRFSRIKSFCEHVIKETAHSRGIEIKEIGFGEEHVHLLISLNPAMSISRAMHLLKGASAFHLFRAFPWLRSNLVGLSVMEPIILL